MLQTNSLLLELQSNISGYDFKKAVNQYNGDKGIKHDDTECKNYPIKRNAIYTVDRAYLYFKFMRKINKNKAFFVIRPKINTRYKIIERNKKNNKSIKADWKIKLTGMKSKEYPDELRLVKFYDKEKQETYEYLTNNFRLSAVTIANIYKARWDIELFFKTIKQNLKIKTFIGTSENAVRTQIWIALITYLLIQFIKHKTKTHYTFLSIFRLLKENVLQNISINMLLAKNIRKKLKPPSLNKRQLRFEF